MNYVTLKKIYFSDPNNYQNEYEARISGPNTIRLNMDIANSPAFIMQSPEILLDIIEIQRIDKKIEKLCVDLPNSAHQEFSRRCLIDEIMLTNNIEGVHSTRKEISEVLNDLEVGDKHKRFYGLVNKYVMLQTKENLSLQTCNDIRNIYNELVLDEVIAENPKNAPDGTIFRKDSVSVANEADKEIHRGLYPEAAILNAMNCALEFLNNSQYDIFIRIAVFHYLIGYIHPFYDGNGRLSRFISSYLLSKELNPLIGYRLSYTIKKNIHAYYTSFKEGNDFRNKGDITPFVISFIEILKKAMNQLYDALEERKLGLDRYKSIIEECFDDIKYQRLMFFLVQASLFSEHGISTNYMLSLCEISRTTFGKRIKYLYEQGLVMRKKIGKEHYYQANLQELDCLKEARAKVPIKAEEN